MKQVAELRMLGVQRRPTGNDRAVNSFARIARMISEDADLRRRQHLGLALIAVLEIAAAGPGVFLGALAKTDVSATSVTAVFVWVSIALALSLGVLGAWIWAGACQEDVARHPHGNVANNRVAVGRTRPPQP